MADNIRLNTNSTTGDLVAADEVGGVKFQYVKLAFGADETISKVAADEPMPVTIISQPANSALAAGSNIIGLVSVNQTTPGTTDAVTVKASAGIGSLTETAPATDTASSGLNGRIQRVAQRLTSLIALLPASLGAKTGANSLSVVPASDATIELKAGSALIGSAAIDQTTDGTTNGISLKSVFALTNNSSANFVSNLVIKATAGKLFKITGYNSGPAQFIQLHDATTLPADTAVPKLAIAVAATSNFSIDFGTIGRSFATGIVVANSTTANTLTTGAADIFVDSQFV